jgi:Fe-S cluster assembly protein SufD
MSDLLQACRQGFLAIREQGHVEEPRREAMDRFLALGLPTTKNEDWKFTSLDALAKVPLEVSGDDGAVEPGLVALVEQLAPMADASRLVFVNGHLRPELSSPVPSGLLLESLGRVQEETPAVLDALRVPRGEREGHALVALNAALSPGGTLLRVLPGVQVRPTLHLVYLSASRGRLTMSHPRTVVMAQPGSRLSLVESFLGHDDDTYLTNAFTEVVVGDGAEVQHGRVQLESRRATHLGMVRVTQGADGYYALHTTSLGSALGRHQVDVRLAQPGAACVLDGLFLGRDRQHLDHHTEVEHAAGRCTSAQEYRGVVDGEARGVFSGRILVQPGAQRTDASQHSRNLVLSPGARVDAKPQLVIHTDDVKCSHGATVGQLDDEPLFYLRSRGIPLDEARGILTYAFVADVVRRAPHASLRSLVHRLVAARLAHAPALEEVA